MIAPEYCCIMEDTVKMFVAGAKKIARIKGLSQGKIAEGTKGVAGLKGRQGTISSYFIGRTRPKPEVMQAIADFLEVSFEKVLEIGRQESKKTINSSLTEEQVRQMIREEQRTKEEPSDITTELHRKVLDKFKQKELALRINKLLVEIEEIDMETLKDAIPVLNLLKIQAAQEAAKKREAGNNQT